jgi:hypothetical protein
MSFLLTQRSKFRPAQIKIKIDALNGKKKCERVTKKQIKNKHTITCSSHTHK